MCKSCLLLQGSVSTNQDHLFLSQSYLAALWTSLICADVLPLVVIVNLCVML